MMDQTNLCGVEQTVLLPLLHRHQLQELLQAVLALQLELVAPEVDGQVAKTML